MYQTKGIGNIPFFVILLSLIFAVSVHAQDPDVEFNPEEDSGFYYTIQKGDTLWDLSQKFYHSQWDWPGLWEMNKEIKNPHWIYPGKKIRVYLKPSQPARPVPEPVQKTDKKPVPKVLASYTYSAMNRIGFIKETMENSLGNIIREQDGNLMMSAADIIYIKPSGIGRMIPGEMYQIFHTEKIKQKTNGKTFQGIKHLIKADIKVLENRKTYVKAVITNSYRDANVGDRIMNFYQRDTVLSVQEDPEPIEGTIICSENNTVMVNDLRVAFIDKGSKANVRAGQIYSILQKNESFFDDSRHATLDPLKSGRLIVLHTEAISSTVLILSSKRDIHPGDMVR